jgi:hypothetical protein
VPLFAVPVEWTLRETVLVNDPRREHAIQLATELATGRRENCDSAECEVNEDAVEEVATPATLPVADGGEREYRLRWEIDISAGSPREAALIAARIQRNPTFEPVFDVTGPDGAQCRIDLEEPETPDDPDTQPVDRQQHGHDSSGGVADPPEPIV